MGDFFSDFFWQFLREFCRQSLGLFWMIFLDIFWTLFKATLTDQALGSKQRYTYRVLQTIQMKLILLCVWADQAVLGIAKTALKFEYEIQTG